ncbi:MAG: ABC transporter ATP-binding protein [Candidatus Heimdallarchaeota archaeon]
MSVVELQHVQYSIVDKRNKTTIDILKDINLKINQSGIYVITGPSGSGKTTLLQIMGTILHQSIGLRKILLQELTNDSSLEQVSDIRKQIGYLFQTPFLPTNISVREYIELQASLSGLGLKTAESKSNELMNQFNIQQFAKKHPTTLSGGEKQRVALAGVLAKNVKLLLLDEPTGSLDYDNKTIIWDLIKQLQTTELTIIVVSHDRSVSEFADESFVLDSGILKEMS